MKINKRFFVISLALALSLLGGAAVFGQGDPAEGDGSTFLDQVILDDLILDGSLCVGLDCVMDELFSFDTIILKENNLRILFNDTSTSGAFPKNDWRISVNDSANGGKSYFRIDDATNDIGTLTIRDGGNVGIGTDDPATRLHVAGDVTVDGVVFTLSDVNAKKEIAPVAGDDVLGRLSRLPIATWSYKSADGGERHMGPMAQDFYATFGLGIDERRISALDTSGVALAAAQELYQVTQAQAAQISALEQQNGELAARLEALEKLVADLQNN